MALRASSSAWVYLRSSSRCPWRSPPAENARLPAPVMTIQPTSSSALIRLTASRSSAPSWAFIALSWSGRFMVTIATPCVFSTRMESAILSLPRVAHERQCGVAYTAGGVSVLTRIDHVIICVPNLEEGIEAYTRIGFHVYPGGAHSGGATHNAIAFHQEDYLELLTLRGGRPAGALIPGSSEARLTEFLARGGGFRYVAVQSDDLGADVAAMRRRGVDVGDATEGSRRTPAGQELRWNVAQLGPSNPLPLLFIQHLTPLAERKRQVFRAGDHPNAVLRTDRVYIAVDDVAKAAETYGVVLGMPVPRLERGNVIKADMAVFNPGPTGLTVAQPAEAGPAAGALARRGPGPFPVLYRTGSMDAAATWMADHGVPPPARGIRNTGEQAMLVGPEHACGAYIGFVGPA